MEYDLIIKNGTVIDGTGEPGYVADVAVRGDAIAGIGSFEGEPAETVDATGLAVAPGFIDIHSHSDMSFFVDPLADSKVRQGVTLEVTGNCGASFCAPLIGDARKELAARLSKFDWHMEPTWTGFDGYLDAVDEAGSVLNVAAQVGHGTVRTAVMGMDTHAPDAGEMARMEALVAESLDAGALGFSTGLFMAPGCYALAEEVLGLAPLAADRGKMYSTHIRSEWQRGSGELPAVMEAIEVARQTGARVQISHVKCGGAMRGRAGEVLELIDNARRQGMDVAGDQYPYAASSGPISKALFPRWALEGGREKTLGRMADEDLRARIRQGLDVGMSKYRSTEAITVAAFPPDRRFDGMTVAAVADDMGVEPAEAVLQLYELADVPIVGRGMAEEDVDLIAGTAFICVSSDGESLKAEGPLSEGRPHPRNYGANARFLGRMVREKGLLSLEEAIRKMTTLPASRLGLSWRGRLAPGYAADIAVFDTATVAGRATFAEPHQYPIGVHHVFVNGRAVVAGGELTGAAPGRALRSLSD